VSGRRVKGLREATARRAALDAVSRAAAPLDNQQVGGTYDSSFTMKTYVHATAQDLEQGRQALAKIHRLG
jgi:hypothetical protein